MKENQRYAFCENCFDDVEYEIKEMGKEAYCKNCGEVVYTPETNDYNLDALYAVYSGIVSL